MPPDQFAQASQECQLVNAVCDSSGFCQFLQPTLDDIRQYYSLLYGEDVSREQIADQGWEVLADEWEFNDRAGFTAEDDVLPECMTAEGIGPDNSLKFDVGPETIAASRRFASRSARSSSRRRRRAEQHVLANAGREARPPCPLFLSPDGVKPRHE